MFRENVCLHRWENLERIHSVRASVATRIWMVEHARKHGSTRVWCVLHWWKHYVFIIRSLTAQTRLCVWHVRMRVCGLAECAINHAVAFEKLRLKHTLRCRAVECACVVHALAGSLHDDTHLQQKRRRLPASGGRAKRFTTRTHYCQQCKS